MIKIKLITVLTSLVLISFSSCAQNNENYFKLNWAVGEKKLISISKNAKEFKDGKLTRDTSALVINMITIISTNDSAYFVDYRMENDLVKYGSLLYKDLKTEFTNDSTIVLKFCVNKTTLKASLLNLDKANSIIDDSYNQITKILESKVPDKMLKSKGIFDLLHQELKDFKFESCELFPILLYSYNKKFEIGDTLITVDSLSNPFNLQNFCGAKIKTYISKKSGKTIDIAVDKTYDFASYKLMIKELSAKMVGATPLVLKGTEQLTGLMSSMLNSVNFEATESMVISRRFDSSWPLKITQHSTMNVIDANSESSAMINTIIEFK